MHQKRPNTSEIQSRDYLPLERIDQRLNVNVDVERPRLEALIYDVITVQSTSSKEYLQPPPFLVLPQLQIEGT